MIRVACLGDVCEIVGGGTPSRKVSDYWGGGIPWATVKDLGSDRITETLESVSQDGLRKSASKLVPAGTVLLVTRVGLGKVSIADIDVAINQDIKALFPCSEVLPEFLFWTLRAKGPTLAAMGVGATVKGITLQNVNLDVAEISGREGVLDDLESLPNDRIVADIEYLTAIRPDQQAGAIDQSIS